MNKSYSKPSTTLQSMKLEGTFMNCSVKVAVQYELEDYYDFTFKTFEDGVQGTSSEWKIGFDD